MAAGALTLVPAAGASGNHWWPRGDPAIYVSAHTSCAFAGKILNSRVRSCWPSSKCHRCARRLVAALDAEINQTSDEVKRSKLKQVTRVTRQPDIRDTTRGNEPWPRADVLPDALPTALKRRKAPPLAGLPWIPLPGFEPGFPP